VQAAAEKLRYLDMLGVPYGRHGYDPVAVSLNCFGAVLEIHRRLGWVEPRLPWFAGANSLEEAAMKWGQDPAAWIKLGTKANAAAEIGDVAVTRSNDAPLGCAVLVSKSPKMFLTATPARGVCIVKARALELQIVSVVRRAEARQ
jgi:hypothetical protein